MAPDVHDVIERHHARYEVTPYYVVVNERSPEGTTRRMVKAGFDIEVFETKTPAEPQPSPEYELLYSVLQGVKAKVSPHTSDDCFIDVIPYDSTVYLDPRN